MPLSTRLQTDWRPTPQARRGCVRPGFISSSGGLSEGAWRERLGGVGSSDSRFRTSAFETWRLSTYYSPDVYTSEHAYYGRIQCNEETTRYTLKIRCEAKMPRNGERNSEQRTSHDQRSPIGLSSQTYQPLSSPTSSASPGMASHLGLCAGSPDPYSIRET